MALDAKQVLAMSGSITISSGARGASLCSRLLGQKGACGEKVWTAVRKTAEVLEDVAVRLYTEVPVAFRWRSKSASKHVEIDKVWKRSMSLV